MNHYFLIIFMISLIGMGCTPKPPSLSRQTTINDGENVIYGSENVKTGFGGGKVSGLSLAIHKDEDRAFSIEMLVKNLAGIFITDPGVDWEPPSSCSSDAGTYDSCDGVTDSDYCNGVYMELNQLYCQLGGESREISSFLGSRLSTGDLVLLWQFALNVCFREKDAKGQTATRLGVNDKGSKGENAKKLISNFLALSELEMEFSVERDFLMNEIFISSEGSEAGVFVNDEEVIQQFGAACVYLTTHPKQTIY